MIRWIAALSLCLFTVPAFANWGIGYNNPVRTTLGVNYMKLWNHLAFEAGAGFNHQLSIQLEPRPVRGRRIFYDVGVSFP
ncbi:MAG: hypothetical protein ABL958_01780 [Bdellovibrionia bacterium]